MWLPDSSASYSQAGFIPISMQTDKPSFPDRIVLLGFMGAGKTTLGKELSKTLARPFVDLDQLIESQEERRIVDIFATEGEDAFRQIEREALLALFLDPPAQAIIASGGGTPCFFDNMAILNQLGTTIYLSVPPEELVRRLIKQAGSRPVLKGATPTTLPMIIRQRLQRRETYYRQADYIMLADEATPEKIISYLSS